MIPTLSEILYGLVIVIAMSITGGAVFQQTNPTKALKSEESGMTMGSVWGAIGGGVVGLGLALLVLLGSSAYPLIQCISTPLIVAIVFMAIWVLYDDSRCTFQNDPKNPVTNKDKQSGMAFSRTEDRIIFAIVLIVLVVCFFKSLVTLLPEKIQQKVKDFAPDADVLKALSGGAKLSTINEAVSELKSLGEVW